ncbi:hypothetical protein PVAP13_4KG378502 [Panicum virgatum]|uniref:Uncharacterized protein n=1 Tax=Panicum virgatum TaxID=38727 RepID=A0A8T0U1N3_PANVG|nr:hypothetical protein PVAP13_4KG378502 [Panicum virgatum]
MFALCSSNHRMMPVQTQMQMRSFLKGKKKRQKGSCFEQSSRRPNVKKKCKWNGWREHWTSTADLEWDMVLPVSDLTGLLCLVPPFRMPNILSYKKVPVNMQDKMINIYLSLYILCFTHLLLVAFKYYVVIHTLSVS